MKSRTKLIGLLFAMLLAAGGCASGPKFTEVKSAIPSVAADKGRVYFYRSGSMFGAAIQPSVMLNGEKVGDSVPGGFFFVDRPAGAYEVLLSTEVERKATFTLEPGQLRYIRMSIGLGVIAGRVHPELVDASQGESEMLDTSYIGTIPLLKGKL